MRILVVHNRYQQKGGEDVVVDAEDQLLRAHGHEVRQLRADNEHIHGLVAKIGTAFGSVYSLRGRHTVEAALRDFRPDLVHVHNFFPTLSPAVFRACSAAGVPVVHTLHNYRIQCAGATLYREGHICEECVRTRSGVPAIRHRCYRASRLGSAVTVLGMALHDELGTWRHAISAYIALTSFAADKLGAFRIPREKIFVKPNFVVDRGVGTGEGDYALFVGRLSPEKGIDTLIEADRAGLLPLEVILLGDGPLRDRVAEAAARPGSRLQLKGFLPPEQIIAAMKRACVLLVPSLWYEAGVPLVAIEALSTGLPIVAAGVGSIAPMLAASGAGLVYTPGDPEALAACLRRFVADGRAEQAMRQAARSCYLATYTPEQNYETLMAIYERASRSA